MTTRFNSPSSCWSSRNFAKASNSSRKRTHGLDIECSNRSRRFFAVLPRKEEMIPSVRATIKGIPRLAATYRPTSVFPQPGGPWSKSEGEIPTPAPMRRSAFLPGVILELDAH